MKQPSWKTPFILSSILFVSGSFAYWLQYSHKPKKERQDANLRKPLAIEEGRQIKQIRVKSAGSEITLECTSLEAKTCKYDTAGSWKIISPVSLPADSGNVRDLLSNLNSMAATETVDLNEEIEEKRGKLIEEYGLGDTRRTGPGSEWIELTLDNGKKIAAHFGEPHPLGDKQFVGASTDGKLNRSTVYLIGNFYKNNVLGKSVSWFRDKGLFTLKREEIESFQLEAPSGRITAQKKDGLWQVNGLEGDYERIETLLSSLAQAKAKDFPEASKLQGLKPHLKLSWNSGTGSSSIQILTKPVKDTKLLTYYLKSPLLKETVEVESNLSVQLDRGLVYLRRNLLLTQGEKVGLTSMKLSGKAFPNAVELSFDGKAWVQKGGEPALDGSKARELLDRLAEGHSPAIVTPAPKAEDPPVVLTLGDGKKPERFRFEFYPARGKKWAKIVGSPRNEAFELEAAVGKAFPFSPDSWKLK
jgi:hypothetical protein